MNRNRIFGLDILRAIAILLVIFNHSIFLLQPLEKYSFFSHIFPICVPFGVISGMVGVDLFFALSGFLIGSILIKTYLNSPSFSFKELKNFWIRRWFRTLPAYYLILLANAIYGLAVFHGFSFHWTVLIKYVFFVQTLWSPPLGFFDESWSLAVEEWFYISLPLFIMLFDWLFKPKDKSKFLFRVFIGYAAVFIAGKFFNAFAPINGNDMTGIRQVVVFKLDSIAYGVIIAYLMYHQGTREFLLRIRKHLFIVSLVLSIVLIAIFYAGVFHPVFNHLYYKNTGFRFFINAFVFSLFPFLFSGMLPYFSQIKTVAASFTSSGQLVNKEPTLVRLITHTSLISYSLYLLNLPWEEWVFKKFISPDSHAYVVVINYIGYWVILFVSSGILYKRVEQPMMNLRDRFSKG